MKRTITITESQALIIRQSLSRTRADLYRTASEHEAEAAEIFKKEMEDLDKLWEMLSETSGQ